MDGEHSTIVPHAETAEEAMRPAFNVCVAFIVIDTIFLVLRFYTVIYLRRKRLSLTWDDWLLIPAYISNMCLLATSLVALQYSIKNHDLAGNNIQDPALTIPIWKALFVATQLKFPSFAFTRYSLLALFLRVFRHRFIRLTCWAIIVYIALQTLAFNLASIFQCTPVNYFWNQVYPSNKGHCFDINAFYRSMPPPEMVVDLILIFLPVPEIWSLRYPRARKVGLTFLFLSGSLALITNSGRLAMYVSHNDVGAVPSIENAIYAWVNATMSSCFIVACIPAMHPLTQRVVPAPIRDAIYRCLDFGRQDQRKRMSTLSSTNGDFRKLVEPKTPLDPAFAGNTGTTTGHAGDRSGPGTVQEPDPPIDLTDFERGQGVLVKKEITVTKEDMFEDVLGF